MSSIMVLASYVIDGSLREVRSVPGTGEVESTGNRISKRVTRNIVVPEHDVDAYVTLDFEKVTKYGAFGENPMIVGETLTTDIDLTYPAPRYWGAT